MCKLLQIILGIALGVCISNLIYDVFIFSKYGLLLDNVVASIDKCEVELPRNKSCVVIAVPKEVNQYGPH